MARISNSHLDEDTYNQILNTLDLILGKLKKDDIKLFLFSLLGKNERIMLSKRLAVILLLDQGVSMSEISKRLKLTKQTVSRLAMTKEIKNKGFELAINKIRNHKTKKEINKILIGLARYTAKAAGGRV